MNLCLKQKIKFIFLFISMFFFFFFFFLINSAFIKAIPNLEASTEHSIKILTTNELEQKWLKHQPKMKIHNFKVQKFDDILLILKSYNINAKKSLFKAAQGYNIFNGTRLNTRYLKNSPSNLLTVYFKPRSNPFKKTYPYANYQYSLEDFLNMQLEIEEVFLFWNIHKHLEPPIIQPVELQLQPTNDNDFARIMKRIIDLRNIKNKSQEEQVKIQKESNELNSIIFKKENKLKELKEKYDRLKYQLNHERYDYANESNETSSYAQAIASNIGQLEREQRDIDYEKKPLEIEIQQLNKRRIQLEKQIEQQFKPLERELEYLEHQLYSQSKEQLIYQWIHNNLNKDIHVTLDSYNAHYNNGLIVPYNTMKMNELQKHYSFNYHKHPNYESNIEAIYFDGGARVIPNSNPKELISFSNGAKNVYLFYFDDRKIKHKMLTFEHNHELNIQNEIQSEVNAKQKSLNSKESLLSTARSDLNELLRKQRKDEEKKKQYEEAVQRWKDQCYIKYGTYYSGSEIRNKFGDSDTKLYDEYGNTHWYEFSRFIWFTNWTIDDRQTTRTYYDYLDTTPPPLKPTNLHNITNYQIQTKRNLIKDYQNQVDTARKELEPIQAKLSKQKTIVNNTYQKLKDYESKVYKP